MIEFAHNAKRDAVLDATGRVLHDPVFYFAATTPIWSKWLENVSDLAAKLGPIFAIVLAVARIWAVLNERRESKAADRAEKGAAIAGAAVSTGAKLGAKWLAPVLGVIGLVALASWLATPAKAQPHAIVSQQAQIKGRKRSADDAGEDRGPIDDTSFSTDVPPQWFLRGRADLGQHERPGRKHNPVIVGYFAAAGFPEVKDDETAWCAAFVGACLERSGIPGSKSLAARSYEKWGVECEPRLGCVVVMSRGDPKGWQGHVGFYAGETPTHVIVLGGNQGDSVSLAKFPKSRVVAYRWPRKVTESRTVRAAGGSAVLGGTSEAIDNFANTPEKAEPILAAIEPVKGSLSELSAYIPIAGKICAVLAVVLALYAAFRRWQDFKARGI